MKKISRRNFLLTAGVVSAAALLAACGSSTSSASSESASESTASSAESAASNEAVEYPITIQHAYGETVIEEKPESIVAIAWGNPDVPLALGVVPTGVSKANFGPVNEDGLLPWTAAGFEKLGASPNVFSDTDGWDYEAISDCAPDVILAAYSGFSEEEYDMLSQIAPTVAYPSVAWSTTWREETIVDTLQTQNLSVGYDETTIIEDLNLEIPAHKVSVIIGANGCGKSTLMKTLSRLLKPGKGQVVLDGKAVHGYPSTQLAQMLGLLPQSPTVPEGITVADLVACGRYPYRKFMAPGHILQIFLRVTMLNETNPKSYNRPRTGAAAVPSGGGKAPLSR